MKKTTQAHFPSYQFQVSDSVMILLITFIVAVFFAILLCFYPGPEFLGSNFWPLIALPGALALGTGFKLVTRKPILQIDKDGIRFFRSKIFISWSQMQEAKVITFDKGDGETEDKLVVNYINAERSSVLQTDFVITDSMNKTSGEVMAALEFFRK